MMLRMETDPASSLDFLYWNVQRRRHEFLSRRSAQAYRQGQRSGISSRSIVTDEA